MAITRIGNPAIADQRGVNFRNIIINGGMDIAQRGTSATGLGNGDSGYHTCDRWSFNENGSPTYEFTMSQDTDVPTGQGFAKSLKMDCTTADAAFAAADALRIQHRIEGQNVQYLKKGTVNAESLTLSFWVKSNKTGTYTIEIYDNDNSRQNGKTYTIDTANTWEKKTITFAGDTTGAFDNDNGLSLLIGFYLGAGSDWTSGTFNNDGNWEADSKADRVSSSQVNLADSTSNEWYITGVQLEAGQVASDFEFLPFDVNLARCQRYYFLKADHSTGAENIGVGLMYNSSDFRTVVNFPVSMRTRASLEVATASGAYQHRRNGGFNNLNDFFADGNISLTSITLINQSQAGGVAGQAGYLFTNSSGAFLAFDAEL
jgi:hypothetical protein